MSKEKVSIQQFLDLLVQKTNVPKKTAEDFLKSLFATIETDLLAGKSVKIKHLGTFKSTQVEARRSVNIHTNEEMTVEGYHKVVFVPDNSLKDLVNQPFEHLIPIDIDGVSELKTSKAANNNASIDPMKTLENQADEIKNVLREIKNMSAAKPDNSHNEVVTEPVKTPPAAPTTANTVAATSEKALTNEEKELDYYTEQKRNYKFLWWLVPTALVFLAVLLYFVVPSLHHNVNALFDANDNTDLVLTDSVLHEQNLIAIAGDSLALAADSLLTDTVTDQNTNVDVAPVLISVSISSGETLVTLAKKHYGHKDFWVYIYEANKDAVANPDKLPAGTIIKVPQLPAEMIDLSNPQTLEKARDLVRQYGRKPTR
ncbi:MAG: HU family DNA-binding protein [Prevotellaceae bacterium]|jgi:nucleoid DNA-binding protein/nucleoid-associated protein YgaU|nr:HU family DNA-binding protein [Prevotellaceae bacterium]